MKKILVPVDFSENNIFALQWAKMLAEKLEAEIVLLNVIELAKYYNQAMYDQYIPTDLEAEYVNQLRETSKKHLNELMEKVDLKGITVETLTVTDNLFLAIDQYTKSLGVDLIIMGTKGVSGMDEWLVGSNTEKVIRMAKRPVLTVRNEPHPIQHIVIASNLQEETAFQTQKHIDWIQSIFSDAKITLLYVNVAHNFLTEREIKTSKELFLKGINTENLNFVIYNEINEEQGVFNFAEDEKADLILLGSSQRKGLAHFFSGSIAENIVNHALLPVITFGNK